MDAEASLLSGIFQHMNSLNKSLQGIDANILTSTDKIVAFQKSIEVWKKHIIKGSLEMFPLLAGLCKEKDKKHISKIILSHLETLLDKINQDRRKNVLHYNLTAQPE